MINLILSVLIQTQNQIDLLIITKYQQNRKFFVYKRPIMDSTLRQRMIQLTQKCQLLSKNGKYDQCIDIMEEIISIKKQVYGMGHLQFEKTSEKLCQYLNLAAMIYLQKQQFDVCLDYLRKAELVARNSLQFKSTTYNNLACYYRRTGKIRTALTYLIQALQLQLKMEHPKTLADTHLNLCAVLSQLDRHDDALQHSMLSIILLQDQFLTILLPKVLDQQNQQSQKPVKLDDQRLAVLAIAYHNMGVEFQHLKRFQEAVKIYKKALNISKNYLKQNEQLIQNLTRVVNSATEQIQQKKRTNHQQRRQKMNRQFSQTKNNIYKDFARHSEKMKNLPKIKFNKDQFQLKQYYNNRQNRQHLSRQREDNPMQRASRSFASRKHPRYYKSYIPTPNNQSRSLASQQTNEINQYGSVPVSEGLKDFNPT